MIVRPAVPADAAAICEITNGIIRDSLITFTTVERTAAQVASDIMDRGQAFLVAEVNAKVAGFATFAPFRAGPGYGFTREHTIQLATGMRGRGIGRALMAQLERQAIAEKVHVLVAGISGANPGACAFHAALGFIETGRMPQVGFKAGQWLDLILMQKNLSGGRDAAPDTGVWPG
jgi:phosphinothricin acetyltransferase